MQLKVMTPTALCIDRAVCRIVAEAPDGMFALLPRHVDFVTALIPGVITYELNDGTEHFVAVNAGTLVKCGDIVRIAVGGAAEGDDLAVMRQRVESEFRRGDDDERAARSALARLEVNMVRCFRELRRGLRD